MPLSARTIVALFVAALTIGMGLGAMSLPKPVESAGGLPSPTQSPGGATGAAGLTASVDQETVAVNQRLTISGALTPAQDGVRLVVERLEGGGWQEFPASTTTGNDGSYSVWIQSGRPGENTFRVVRSDDGTASDEVRVTIV